MRIHDAEAFLKANALTLFKDTIMQHLSPVQMTTREFGLLWVNLIHESCIITNKSHTLDSLGRQLEEEGRFGIVESKGTYQLRQTAGFCLLSTS